MDNKTASSGNRGKGVRSDCFIQAELTENSGVEIHIQSKVKVLYGESIKKQLLEMVAFFEINNIRISIEDFGALPFVIAARLEAVICKLLNTEKTFLLPLLEENKYETLKDRNRFSRLYLPGNSPALMINAGIHKPDGIILDLEDAVAPEKKDEARYLVRNALRQIDFYGAEKMVRINQIPLGLDDLDYIIPHNVNLVLIPKCETAEQIHQVEKRIADIKKREKLNYSVWLMPIIESALGVVNAYSIAKASENVVSLAIGLEDYTADLGTKRTNEATESFYARSQVVNAARAAGIQPIDSVFSDVADLDALKENVIKSKALGFDGMGCIHPRQIKVITDNFAPDVHEIEKAKKIVNAFLEAGEKGFGVVSLGTKMIDPPVYKRAMRTIKLAISLGKMNENWREQMLLDIKK